MNAEPHWVTWVPDRNRPVYVKDVGQISFDQARRLRNGLSDVLAHTTAGDTYHVSVGGKDLELDVEDARKLRDELTAVLRNPLRIYIQGNLGAGETS